jgi:hypothetical protein
MHDPIAHLRLFPGSVAEQVIALTDLWRDRSQRSFVAMREHMNEVNDLNTSPAAFDNHFRRGDREKTPEELVWGLIRIMRDDEWLPKAQQCTLAEALYLAALKNVSVLTYARIYRLFPGEEVEFRALCPLGEFIVEQITTGHIQPEMRPLLSLNSRVLRVVLLVVFIALLLWTAITSFGFAAP